MLIIDDNTPDYVVVPDTHRVLCGTIPQAYPDGKVCGPASTVTLPWEQFPDRIADIKRNRCSVKDIFLDSKIGVKLQTLNYCHSYSAVSGVMIEREVMGLPYVPLSPSSVGAPITGFTNSGAYIEDALKQLVNVGCTSTEFVPESTYDGRDFKPGWKANAAKHKVIQWGELPSRNFQAHASAVLLGKPVPMCFYYMKHAMLFVEVVDLDTSLPCTNFNRYGLATLNSWGDWGDHGFGTFRGTKALADCAYIIEQVTNSDD